MPQDRVTGPAIAFHSLKARDGRGVLFALIKRHGLAELLGCGDILSFFEYLPTPNNCDDDRRANNRRKHDILVMIEIFERIFARHLKPVRLAQCFSAELPAGGCHRLFWAALMKIGKSRVGTDYCLYLKSSG